MENQKEVKTNNVNSPDKPNKKNQNKEKKPRPERKQQYQYNPDIINENTQIPPLPKKNQLIPKPDIKLFKEKQARNNAKIEEIFQKKKTIRAEKFKFNRKTQGDSDNKYSAFQNQITEVQQVRQKFNEVKNERNGLKEQLQKAIEQAKANNQKIKQYKSSLKGSRQNFTSKLQQLQHRLITANITKDEEKNLNAQIMILKRKIRDAESSGNIQFKLEECKQRKQILDEEIHKLKNTLEPLNIQFQNLKADLDKKNQHITGLKGQISAEKSQKTQEKQRHDREYEKWKEQKSKRLEKLQAQINRIKQDNKKIWEDYHEKQDKYWKQKHYIDFIEWQTKVKNRKIGQKEREAKRMQYQKKDKEREKSDQLKQYLAEIELINFLIKYLNGLKTNENSNKFQQKKEIKINPADIKAQLATDSQWKKEKGVEIILSKKSKVQQQPQKKHKKNKKKVEQNKQEVAFSIPYNVQIMFENLKLLPPTKIQQVDDKINELKERQSLFERVSRQQSSEQQKKLAAEIKQKKAKVGVKAVKKQQVEEFPSI